MRHLIPAKSPSIKRVGSLTNSPYYFKLFNVNEVPNGAIALNPLDSIAITSVYPSTIKTSSSLFFILFKLGRLYKISFFKKTIFPAINIFWLIFDKVLPPKQ